MKILPFNSPLQTIQRKKIPKKFPNDFPLESEAKASVTFPIKISKLSRKFNILLQIEINLLVSGVDLLSRWIFESSDSFFSNLQADPLNC